MWYKIECETRAVNSHEGDRTHSLALVRAAAACVGNWLFTALVAQYTITLQNKNKIHFSGMLEYLLCLSRGFLSSSLRFLFPYTVIETQNTIIILCHYEKIWTSHYVSPTFDVSPQRESDVYFDSLLHRTLYSQNTNYTLSVVCYILPMTPT